MNANPNTVPLPANLGARFDHLLSACWLPAQWATRVDVASDLPLLLERSVRRLQADHEWRAFIDDSHTYCAIARTGPDSSHDASTVMLEVFFLDCDATVYAAGVWYYDRERGWKVHDVPDIAAETSRRHILPLLDY